MRESLPSIAKKLVAEHKGLLAADESVKTATKRLAAINLESTAETRRQYRELFFKTEGIEKYISGVILFDETIRQRASDGEPFAALLGRLGIIPGIKVDQGTVELPDHPGEKLTVGLDGLPARLAEYYAMGARFSKWRAVIAIGQGLPSEDCIGENAKVLAQYAALSQEAGLVPVVEPEVLIDGDHDIGRSAMVTGTVLAATFQQLREHQVALDGIILKSSMVISGSHSPQQASPAEVAQATLACFQSTVPPEVPGIVFLSGGQTAIRATENLNAVNALKPSPWKISFSYARALQGPPLEIWKGIKQNLPAARREFIKRMAANVAANQGKYSVTMESDE